MIDLSNAFQQARSTSIEWRLEDVQGALHQLANGHSAVDWEIGDEEWGRVIAEDETIVGLVCVRVPIGFVLGEVDPKRLSTKVLWVQVASLETSGFSIDPALLREIFPSVSDQVDFSAVSINDLWYATV